MRDIFRQNELEYKMTRHVKIKKVVAQKLLAIIMILLIGILLD
jgi:hypothetical protein